MAHKDTTSAYRSSVLLLVALLFLQIPIVKHKSISKIPTFKHPVSKSSERQINIITPGNQSLSTNRDAAGIGLSTDCGSACPFKFCFFHH
jgi:hypothetical protein